MHAHDVVVQTQEPGELCTLRMAIAINRGILFNPSHAYATFKTLVHMPTLISSSTLEVEVSHVGTKRDYTQTVIYVSVDS